MDPTLNFQPRNPPRYRGRAAALPPAPPAPLTLVGASCTEAPTLILSFDRPIDVSGLVPGLLRVDNGLLMYSYVGYDTPVQLDPNTVEVPLSGIGDYDGPGVILTAAAGNGIVAADGGAAWAGCAGVELPVGGRR